MGNEVSAATATPTRDRTLDVLRAVATFRVLVFHATGDVQWSWFAAMPIMFFVGGSLYAQSLDRRSPREVLTDRLRRILIPTWVWAAAVFVTYTVAGVWSEVPWHGALGFVLPIVNPSGPPDPTGPLHWTWMHMWYITAYVILMLLGSTMRRIQRRWPVATFVVLLVPVLVSGVLQTHEIGALTFIIVFWIGGYAYHDHRDRLPSTLSLFLVASAAAACAVAYAAAFTGFGIDLNQYPLLFDLVGLAAVAAALAARSWISRLCRIRAIDIVVTWFQQRALTVYLWHAMAVGAMWSILGRDTLESRNDLIQIGIVVGLTFVITGAVGWVEDVAARRPARLFPPTPHRHSSRQTVIDLRTPRTTLDLRSSPAHDVQDSSSKPNEETSAS